MTDHPSLEATSARGPFGQPVRRIEDPALLTGNARFADDIHFPGMLQAAFVRSAFAHAKINGINTDVAMQMPGVRAVYTIENLAPYLSADRLSVGMPSKAYKQQRDRPILANDEVCHVGEPIAVVIAEDRYLAEDAAALVEVAARDADDLHAGRLAQLGPVEGGGVELLRRQLADRRLEVAYGRSVGHFGLV